MTEEPSFGTRLGLLLGHRGVTAEELAARGGPDAAALRAVLAGAPPAGDLLRDLAPALGLHAVDLFTAADLDVPDDLAPPHPDAERQVGVVVARAAELPRAGRQHLLERMRALPDEDPGPPFGRSQDTMFRGTPGGRIVFMLRRRNLGWMGFARVLAFWTPTYLAASTYGMIGTGRSALTPRRMADFGTVLGIDAHELALLTGGPLPDPTPPSFDAEGAAALLWEARRLSAAQLVVLEDMVTRAHGNGPGG